MSARTREFHQLYATARIAAQLSFYQGRAQEYHTAQRQAVILRNMLLFTSATTAALGQLTTGTERAAWSAVAAVLASLGAALTAYQGLIGFPQLDKLYSDAARNLEEAAIDWRSTEQDTDLTAAIERVEDIFRSEIGQWGQLIVKATPPPGQGGHPIPPEDTPRKD